MDKMEEIERAPDGPAPAAPGRAPGLLYAALGFFALVAQTLQFRFFFETFEGSELGVACFFTAWLVWVALGAAAARGRWIGPLIPRFAVLALLYLPAFVLQYALIHRTRAWAGIAAYELFPLLRLAPAAFLACAPVSLLTGFLFTLACAGARRPGGGTVARVYALESAGGFAGGALATAALAAGMTEERLFLAAAALLCAAVAHQARGRALRAAGWILALAPLAAGLAGLDRAWTAAADRDAWERRLPGGTFLGRFTTPQATYRYGGYRGAFVALARETVAESVPDEPRAAEIAALHLAARPAARRVLVIGPAACSICREFLKIPSIEEVCWLHPDPAYPAAWLARLPPELRPDPARLRAPAEDARAFLRRPGPPYDLVVLAVPDALTLAMNRYFTAEFYALVRGRLADGGLAGLRFSGAENFLGPEFAALGASVVATAATAFPHARLKPGDESWLLTAPAPLDDLTPARLAERFAALPGSAALCRPELLLSLFPTDRADFQMAAYRAVLDRSPPGALVNTDARPRAPAQALLLALKQGGLDVGRQLSARGRPAAAALLFALLLYPLVRTVFLRRGGLRPGPPGAAGRGLADASALVFAAGAGGMALSLLLMFLYQSAFGELFLHAGLLSALYMLGLFAGTALAQRAVARRPPSAVPLAAVLLLHLALIAGVFLLAAHWSRIAAGAAFVLGGCLCGAYVPLVARRFLAAGLDDRAAGARIEALDHLGGAAGGLLAGLLVLPLLGVDFVPALLAALALAALPALAAGNAAAIPNRSLDAWDRFARRAGCTLFFAAAVALFFAHAAARERERAAGDPLLRTARAMRADANWRVRETVRPDGAPIRYLACSSPEEFVFRTDGLADDVPGYAGPIVLAVRLTPEGELREFRTLRCNETPSYLGRTLEWQAALTNRNLFATNALADVDAVSGATVTCHAMKELLRTGARAFAADALQLPVAREAAPPPPVRIEVLALGAMLLAGLALRLRPRPWPRRILLLALVAVGGVLWNLQYSFFQVQSLLAPWPRPGPTLAFALTLGVPLAALLFGNVYCGWLCPFGALQEWIGEFRPARWRTEPHPQAWRYGRWLKFLLLGGAALFLAVQAGAPLGEADPMTRFFSGAAGHPLPVFAAAVLALSFFYRRFWCRNLCPAGAFLSLVGAVQPLARWLPAAQPGRCDLGVRRRADLDCIRCDRCRDGRAIVRPGRYAGLGPREWIFFAAVLATVAWLIVEAAGAVRAPVATAGGVASVLSPAKLEHLRELQRTGHLSDREAMYYRPAPTNPPAR